MKRCLTRLRCAMALKFPGQEAIEIENFSKFNKSRQCDGLEISRTKHCKYDVMKRCLTTLRCAMALKFPGQEVDKDEYLGRVKIL